LKKVAFHPEAGRELLAAARYYEAQAQNLGVEFLEAVELACSRLTDHPEVGRPFGARLRRVLVARFPFAVVYRAEADRTLILAVAHLRRKPGYWRARSQRAA